MPKRIFIGSLSVQTTSDDLKKLFSQAGTVSSAHIDVSRDGRCRGTAQVEMSTAEEGTIALRQLNGAELHGSRIVVRDTEDATSAS